MIIIVVKIIWSVILLFGMIGAICGLILPIIPHVPFLMLIILSLKKIAPNWLQRQKWYTAFVVPKLEYMTRHLHNKKNSQ